MDHKGVEEILASKRILISGGTGFVGSATVRALAERHPKCAITVIDRSPPRPQHALPDGIRCMQVDVTSAPETSKAFQTVQPNIVIHTAGIVPGLPDRFGRRLEKEVWRINVVGTQNMLDAATENEAAAFIYTSSCCVVTDDIRSSYANVDEKWPTSSNSLIYGESKVVPHNCNDNYALEKDELNLTKNQATAEALVLNASSDKMATCALRPSVLCGPGDCQLVPAIHACIAKYETPFVIGTGDNLWDVTHVSNIADSHVLAVENMVTSRTAAGEAFFIQNNEPIAFRNFCLAIWAHFGHVPPFEIRIPEGLAYLVGWLCEMATWVTGGTTTLSRGGVQDACAVRYANGKKAKEILGYEARIGIEDAIRLSCEVSQDYEFCPCAASGFGFIMSKKILVTYLEFQEYAHCIRVKLPAKG
ncbi:3-beta hydroxysteroid dehydrogenase/isomerase [Penicillium angulare]|uniref:3-beta hydroxysteroid dehydrogenase/isomerase n=1 Tax=Penicillium angulare TaxID=116970 RepID=UPI00254242B7|nr:3-beta hydroxysteroid dehydrogenase/isomerase [Penicillium angulare]KAJ5267606.1 3-beta hydroxysteroid dehydrogenase/isomerase [Penicillium angulare]